MKFKILVVNKFYYRRGGDCIYSLNLEKLLASRGHEVAVYSMRTPDNLPSKYERYFADEVSFSGGIFDKIRGMRRVLGVDRAMSARFKSLLDDFRPDVVHLNNVHSYLSPLVARMARESGAKVVWTMHDYKLLCPAYTCSKNGEWCSECVDSPWRVLECRCMKRSISASLLGYAERLRWNRRRLQKWVDAFICPSGFILEKMKRGGYDADKLVHLGNFVDVEPAVVVKRERTYYCYVGRLSSEKGVETLLKAASSLPYELVVAGDGELGEEMRARYRNCENIRFLGLVSPEEVSKILCNARFSVMPSECNENNPLSVIESLVCGTPAVVSDVAGLPELIAGDCGLTFASGDVESLTTSIRLAWNRQWNYESIFESAIRRYSREGYYESLMSVYGRGRQQKR